MLLHDQKISLATEGVSYTLTPFDQAANASVSFVVKGVDGGGAFRVLDYFTPEQADEMAAAFTEVARRARRANGIEVEATPGEVRAFERLLIQNAVENGHEDKARERFGDALVDAYFCESGEDPHAARCECDTPETCELRDRSGDAPEGFTLPPILAAMQEIVDRTPDRGDGSRFDHRSRTTWELVETWRTADEPDTIAEFVDDVTTGDQVRECVQIDAARAVSRWLVEDKAPPALAAAIAGRSAS